MPAQQSNPLPPTPENLKAGQSDFEEHCAGCHGLEGDGENRFEADFNPPIPKLTGGAQKWSDGELYFIIANGIAMTAMPGFGKNHDPKEIWGIVLWMRHLAQLSSVRKSSDRISHAYDHRAAREDDEGGSSLATPAIGTGHR